MAYAKDEISVRTVQYQLSFSFSVVWCASLGRFCLASTIVTDGLLLQSVDCSAGCVLCA